MVDEISQSFLDAVILAAMHLIVRAFVSGPSEDTRLDRVIKFVTVFTLLLTLVRVASPSLANSVTSSFIFSLKFSELLS